MAEARRAVAFGLALTFATFLLAAPVPAFSQVRSGPSWSDLAPAEKQLLAPLQPDWDKWDLLRKNKWLEVAKRYPTLPAPEQERIRERMAGWAKLSTQERAAARENFKGLKKLPPEQRNELPSKWMEYQSLPPEQRQELQRAVAPRAPGAPKPVIAVQPPNPPAPTAAPAVAPSPAPGR